MPKVSIIVPVYNSEQYLDRCVESILTQTFTDFELILIDDGSPDNCPRMCEEWSKKDNRIHVIHKPNGGVSSARNVGIKYSTGEYLLFIDSDDAIEKDYVEKLLNNACDLTICGLKYYNKKIGLSYQSTYEESFFDCVNEDALVFLYANNCIYSANTKLYRRDIIENNNLRFSESVSWGEDSIFVMDYIRFANTINVIKYNGYKYFQTTQDSLSSKVRVDIMDNIVYSRMYCLEQTMRLIGFNSSISDIIKRDMKNSCEDFLFKHLNNEYMHKTEKESLLNVFLTNDVVKEIVVNSIWFKEYSNGNVLDSKCILKCYKKYVKKSKRNKNKVNVYKKVPQSLKKLWRKLKVILNHA